MKKEKRYWFVARRNAIHALQVSDVMDMLGYDSTRVECNPPRGMYLMSKVQEGGYPPPTVDRWKSIGVQIHSISVSKEEPSREDIVRVVEAEEAIIAAQKARAR
jgi:hypothetical protein